jgi:NADPH-dependent 2,4-dienoyl-CoA reductase/sulfur reductase-like enzyme
MSKPRLVLIGNGMAGVRTVEELLKIKPDHYDITIFGAEPHPNYNRILLSPVLAGEMTIRDRPQRTGLVQGKQHQAAYRQATSPRSTASSAR